MNFDDTNYMNNMLYMNFNSISNTQDVDKYYDWYDIDNNNCEYYSKNLCKNNSVLTTNNINLEYLKQPNEYQLNNSLSEVKYRSM